MTQHVAETAKKRASDKILAKIGVLEKWKAKKRIPWLLDQHGKPIRDDNGLPSVDYVPDDERAFCQWVGNMNSASTVRANPELQGFETLSRSTLTQPHNSVHRETVVKLMAALQQIAEIQVMKLDLRKVNEALEKERDYWRRIATEGSKDVVEQRRKAAKAENLLRTEIRAREHNDNLLNERIDELECQVAALTSQLSKVQPLIVRPKK